MNRIRFMFVLALFALICVSCSGPIVPPSPIPESTVTATIQPTSTPILPDVNITYPIEGGKVLGIETVKGASQAIPSGSLVWVVVFLPSVGRYYPQNFSVDMQANGEWSSVVYIGQEGDVGLRADIIVVIADNNAQGAIQAYLQNARDAKNFAGMERIPDGAMIYDRMTVERK